jgi:UDP-N-acetylmuramoyl-L-alanyl-D-glutamate--2,6-diaminopimelate ligase
MRLSELAQRLPMTVTREGDAEVDSITHDSRQVAPGALFAALPGANHHGLDFLEQAVARGAVAVLSDRPRPDRSALPWLRSESPREAMARAAWILVGEPAAGLDVVAVTGTNGKSTVVDLVRTILDHAGRPCAWLGTLGGELPGGGALAVRHTTPEAPDLALFAARARDAGASALVLEASSHALVQHRLTALPVDVAVFTNLSRDHLDYHADMEDYFAAKRRLFDELLVPTGRRILPADDPWSARLMEGRGDRELLWGIEAGGVQAQGAVFTLDGTRFDLVVDAVRTPVELPLVGRHNLCNALAAAAATIALGLAPSPVAAGLGRARPLSGRLERIDVDLQAPVFVDFAHTPDGLEAVLASLAAVTDRRLVVVFGAGGDRDRGKREPMGRAVGRWASVAVVTSDNPRSEDPADIAASVAAGVRAEGAEPEVILDRRQAIARALDLASDDTVIVVAGKGHEATQTIGDRVMPFSDQDVIREIAAKVAPCS